MPINQTNGHVRHFSDTHSLFKSFCFLDETINTKSSCIAFYKLGFVDPTLDNFLNQFFSKLTLKIVYS